MSVEMLEKIVHHFGGILGPAHPFGPRSSSAMFFNKMRKNPHLIRKFDFSGGIQYLRNRPCKSNRSASGKKYGKQCFGGSDSHKEEYVGMAFTDFDRGNHLQQ